MGEMTEDELICQIGQQLSSKFKVEGSKEEHFDLKKAKSEACIKSIEEGKPITVYIVKPYTTISIEENHYCE